MALTDGILSAWTFDEESTSSNPEPRLDSYGNRDLSDPDWVASSTTAKHGLSADFGSITFGMVNTGDAFNPSSFSFSGWVNVLSPSTPNRWIISKMGDSTDLGFRVGMDVESAQSRWMAKVSYDGSNEITVVDTSNNPASGWVHFCVTFDHTAPSLKLYINGTEQDESTDSNLTSGLNASTEPLTVGDSDYVDALRGKYDDFALWNRALSSSEVTELWNDGDGLAVDDMGDINETGEGGAIAGGSASDTIIDNVSGTGGAVLSGTPTITGTTHVTGSGGAVGGGFGLLTSATCGVLCGGVADVDVVYSPFIGEFSGLMSGWKFDETSTGVSPVVRTDRIGNRDLSDSDNVPSATGLISNAADFTDADASDTLLNTGKQFNESSLSVSLWVKITSYANNESSTNQHIISKWSNTVGDYGFAVGIVDIGGSNFRLQGRMSYDGDNIIVVEDTAFRTTGAWHHVVLTIDHTLGEMTLYVNGVERDQVTNSNIQSGVYPSTTTLAFGEPASGFGVAVRGAYDESTLWNRALTPTEVVTFWNEGNGLSVLNQPQSFTGGLLGGDEGNLITTYNTAVAGGSVAGGSATVEIALVGESGVLAGSSASVASITTQTGTGGAVLGGTATDEYVSTPVITGGAVLNGDGQDTGTWRVAASITSTVTVTASAIEGETATATISGTGTLTLSPTLTISSITPSGGSVCGGQALLTGTDRQRSVLAGGTAAVSDSVYRSASLSGTATLTGAINRHQTRQVSGGAVLNGGADVVGTETRTATGGGACGGTQAGGTVKTLSASLTSTGSLTATAIEGESSTAAISSTATLTASALLVAGFTPTGGAKTSGTAAASHSGSEAVSGGCLVGGRFTPNPVFASATLSFVGSLTADATETETIVAALTSTGTLTGTATVTTNSLITLPGLLGGGLANVSQSFSASASIVSASRLKLRLQHVPTTLMQELDQYLSASLNVHPCWLPDNTSYPAVTFHRVSSLPSYHLDNPTGLTMTRVQFDVWSTNYGQVVDTSNRLKVLLHGYSGDMGAIEVLSARLDTMRDIPVKPTDGRQTPVYHRTVDCMIDHNQKLTV